MWGDFLYTIKEIHKDERPRERLLTYGIDALTKVELIALLIGSGTKDRNVFQISQDVVKLIEKVNGVDNVTIEQLLTIKGIKLAKATTLIAALSLSKKFDINRSKKHIFTHRDVYLYMHEELKNKEQEHLYCIYLNSRSEIIKSICLFVGTVNQTVIHPREIFKHATRLSAYSIVLVHNHPTGDSKASNADIKATENLMKLSEMMGIIIVDHVIIGKNEYFSIIEHKKYKL